MLTDQHFYELRASRLERVRAAEVTLMRAGVQISVVTKATVGVPQIDPRLRSLLPTELTVTAVEIWGAHSAEGASGTLAVDVAGVPATITGRTSITHEDAGSSRRFWGEAKSSVPLFGHAIEEEVAVFAADLAHAEAEAQAAYAAELPAH